LTAIAHATEDRVADLASYAAFVTDPDGHKLEAVHQ